MNSAKSNKISIRPILAHLVLDNSMSPEEQFQNGTLRPILKMQHELIVVIINEYLRVKKNAFYSLSEENKPDYIKVNLLGDSKILHELRGIILGQFTLEEMEYYLKNKSTSNKRIQSLLFQRISSFL